MILNYCPICLLPVKKEDKKIYIEAKDFKGFVHKNCLDGNFDLEDNLKRGKDDFKHSI